MIFPFRVTVTEVKEWRGMAGPTPKASDVVQKEAVASPIITEESNLILRLLVASCRVDVKCKLLSFPLWVFC